MLGGSLGHQRIVFNLLVALAGLLDGHTGETLSLPGVGVSLPMADLYRGLIFPA